MIHELKTDPGPFDAVWNGDKTHEIRRNNRGFVVGDLVLLRRTNYDGAEMAKGEASLEYTGTAILAEISHVQRGYGLAQDWVVLSVRVKWQGWLRQGGGLPVAELAQEDGK